MVACTTMLPTTEMRLGQSQDLLWGQERRRGLDEECEKRRTAKEDSNAFGAGESRRRRERRTKEDQV